MSGDAQEGWDAPLRGPLIAMAALLAVLAGGLVTTGSYYRGRVQGATHAPLQALRRLPEPRLETMQTPPGQRRTTGTPHTPPALARAMAETAAQGNALWGSARP